MRDRPVGVGLRVILEREAIDETRTGGRWRPSAGSIYPTLQQLEDEGLVRGEQSEGRNVYALTDEGRKAAEEARRNRAPWEMADAAEVTTLWGEFRPLAAASLITAPSFPPNSRR